MPKNPLDHAQDALPQRLLLPLSSNCFLSQGLPSRSTVQPRILYKLTRVLVRENEYSLYSHVPRVLSQPLDFTPRKCPFVAALSHISTTAPLKLPSSNSNTRSGITGAQAMFCAKSRFAGYTVSNNKGKTR
ncbi:hypothetical protein BJ741DRAFT_668526 [Chytriomyces cf. hyalinus JEL632]|nr:hypothetical protein BJ741DRAFT_668526 [Chytriomyces cf. hyalinus JEL632]